MKPARGLQVALWVALLGAAVLGSAGFTARPSDTSRALAQASGTAVPTVPQSLSVPLTQPTDADTHLQGSLQTIPVTINGIKLRLLVDTGSSGVRIFSNKLGVPHARRPPAISPTGLPRTSYQTNFHGMIWEGPPALATMTIEGYTLPPIAVQVVYNAWCSLGKNCQAKNGMRGMERQGFDGNFGIAPSAQGFPDQPASFGNIVFDPLAQLPPPLNSGFIVEFAKHALILGLTPQNSAGFNDMTWATSGPYSNLVTQPNGAPAWKIRGLVFCYQIPQMTLSSPCWRSGPDTGGGDMNVTVAQPVPTGLVNKWGMIHPGNVVRIASRNMIDCWTIVTGTKPGVNVINLRKGNTYTTDSASTPYYWFDIKYDMTNNIFGWRVDMAAPTAQPATCPPPPTQTPTPTPGPSRPPARK